MVFYRKYRPQTVSELDLESVREKLENILKAKELSSLDKARDVPHAFLFTGPKGLGKTSAARILAKAINCQVNQEARIKKQGKKASQTHDSKFMIHDSNFEPCNKCDACISITNGSNLDVLEIDAASNRGIDEIRDLREKIKFAPATLQKKVYIIDEVHMLTQDAFNALLKTLEEPPSHAIFILCTTEEEKIPQTVSSRAFHVNFTKPRKDEVIRSISRIIKGEKLDVEKGVLEEIYNLSEGSFRDAAKILEELTFTAVNKKITKEIVEQTYKTGSIDQEVEKLIAALAKKDVKTGINIIEHLSEKGTDFKVVTEKIAAVLHDAMLARAGLPAGKQGINFDTETLSGFGDQELKDLLEKVNHSYRDIKFSVLPQIPLELVVVEWCLEEVQSSKFKVQSEEGGMPEKKEKKAHSGTLDRESQVKKRDEGRGELFRDNALQEDFFTALINTVRRDNHSIAGILRGCKLVDLGKDTVRLETAFKFHRDKLNEAKVRSVLDKRSSEILRRDVRVVVDMIEKKV